MAQNKTQPTDVPVADFLDSVEPERRRLEGLRVDQIMSQVTGAPGVMWGPTMVGYGEWRYRSPAGRTGDWFKVGFSPRKAKFTFYGLKDSPEQEELLPRLGPHTVGAGCVYVNRLDALDEDILRQLIAIGFTHEVHASDN